MDHNKGIKHDAGKILPDLVLGDFMAALEQAVFAGTFGAHKYEPKNFQQLEGGETRYAEAAFRHYIKRKKGELFDTESGELHHAHELWCRIAELYFWLKTNGDRTWEKAIRSENGMYYHPTLDEFGNPWQAEPFWFNETDARQMIWHLAGKEKGELSIKVEARPVLFEAPVFEAELDPQQLADIVSMVFNSAPVEVGPYVLYNYLEDAFYAGNEAWSRDINQALDYDKPVVGLLVEMPNTMFVTRSEAEHEPPVDDTKEGVYVSYFDKWLSGYSDAGLSEYHIDPQKAIRLHRGCAEKFIIDHPDLPLEIHPDIWFVKSESGDFYLGEGVWETDEREACAWTKKEAAAHIEYLNKHSNTKPRLVPA